jgi:hypothetical protein
MAMYTNIEQCNIRGRRWIGGNSKGDSFLINKTDSRKWYGQSAFSAYGFTPEFKTLKQLDVWLANN